MKITAPLIVFNILLGLFIIPQTIAAQTEKGNPNVILILTDDQGLVCLPEEPLNQWEC